MPVSRYCRIHEVQHEWYINLSRDEQFVLHPYFVHILLGLIFFPSSQKIQALRCMAQPPLPTEWFGLGNLIKQGRGLWGTSRGVRREGSAFHASPSFLGPLLQHGVILWTLCKQVSRRWYGFPGEETTSKMDWKARRSNSSSIWCL